MKKILLICAAVFVLSTFSGCKAVSSWYSEHKEEIYDKLADRAVLRLSDMVDTHVDKLMREGKITETYASELKNKCKKAIRDAFVAIDEIRAESEQK